MASIAYWERYGLLEDSKTLDGAGISLLRVGKGRKVASVGYLEHLLEETKPLASDLMLFFLWKDLGAASLCLDLASAVLWEPKAL